jgi:WD40 repeat protein
MIIVAGLISNAAPAKDGSPFDNLPKNMERLTYFGGRADFSPDGKTIAFVSKDFGDVMTMDLKTREIKCLTNRMSPNHPEPYRFIRVVYLPTGDYLLVGTAKWPEPKKGGMNLYSSARHNYCELWYLSKEEDSLPVSFGFAFYEAASVSKKQMKIAYVLNWWSTPELEEGLSQLYVSDIDVTGETPKLVNPKLVMESKFPPDYRLAAQDFYDNDTKITVLGYQYTPKNACSVLSVDLKTLEVTDLSKAKIYYDEPEGMFPDQKHIIVESTRHVPLKKNPPDEVSIFEVDFYKMKMDGSGDMERLTWISDFKGYKAQNPVISPDGEFMVFDIWKGTSHGDSVPRGLVLYRFE